MTEREKLQMVADCAGGDVVWMVGPGGESRCDLLDAPVMFDPSAPDGSACLMPRADAERLLGPGLSAWLPAPDAAPLFGVDRAGAGPSLFERPTIRRPLLTRVRDAVGAAWSAFREEIR